ncbi:MAG: tetratricopeptide repeat protein [Candidatus Babeliales bacterium]|jgi:tetratricopeptide (TPR) repeat protein
MKKFFLLAICFVTTTTALFDDYKAAKAYQAGDFQKAQQYYQQQLVNDPFNGQLLFNNGDVAYRLGNYEQASAYFNQAVKHLDGAQLQEQAAYNAGNAYFRKKTINKRLMRMKKL